ncbi:MAG: chromate ion family chromate transporter [Gammaproteobacteria bacterium]|nr:MAG: chromate ion family chromate transporter [Gammaproteobacteria bacterium]
MNEVAGKNNNNGNPIEVFFAFLKLGLSSFGGPVAHLGYFRKELIQRRGWLSDNQFGQLLAICQFLPGPASSQLGFCLGLLRGGWLGALLAFLAFTLPSAMVLIAFSAALPMLSDPVGVAVIHGLKLVACAVVADAVLGMAKTLCPDVPRRVIAVLALAALLVVSSTVVQLLVVVCAALAGMLFFRNISAPDDTHKIPIAYGRGVGLLCIVVFAALLIGLPILATAKPDVPSVASAFYQAGALVFGGGHVVLPLLQDSIVAPGWVSPEQFLAGYGASQAIPGPLFAFSAFLGSVIAGEQSAWLMAAVALGFMFLPGFLLILGVLPFWSAVSHNPLASRAIAGVNAAVVGLLAAALYNPVFTSGISGWGDLVIAAVGFGLLALWRLSPLVVVVWCVLAKVVLSMLMA